MAATQFTSDCPYCGAKQAAFQMKHVRGSRVLKGEAHSVAACGVCDENIILTYFDPNIARRGFPLDVISNQVDFPGSEYTVLRTIPQESQAVPQRLPENVASFFKQAMNNERAQNWDASGAMFRKTLDVATKILDPSLSALTLYKRIEKLVDIGRLTGDLAIWSHEVRIDGNDAVHGDEPETQEDVSALHEFCRAILLYTFTLPSLVADRSSKRQKN